MKKTDDITKPLNSELRDKLLSELNSELRELRNELLYSLDF